MHSGLTSLVACKVMLLCCDLLVGAKQTSSRNANTVFAVKHSCKAGTARLR